MSVWLVIGGQFGSEGKGRTAASIAVNESIDIAIRCGGPNSGHSFIDASDRLVVMQQLPTAVIRKETRLLIPAGAFVDLEILRREIDDWKLSPDRVGIDHNCTIIGDGDKLTESDLRMVERIGSTLTGVGAAMSRRVLRTSDVRLARDCRDDYPWLRNYLTDVSLETNRAIDEDKNILIEGTQGFGLSNLHSEFYPHATSRDTTAAGFLAEVGISPRTVTFIVLVLRVFPIRVAGNSGPLENEMTWEELKVESGSPESLREYTTVTKKLRRVGRFDINLARRAVAVNRPNWIALNFLDHIDYKNRSIAQWNALTAEGRSFVIELERELNVPIRYCGTGPSLDDVIKRGSAESDRLMLLASPTSEGV